MKETTKGSKSICILGMHRSGTSVITRAVNLLGAYLGEDEEMMPPTEDNPRGYWERNDIMDIDDRILAQMKMSWDTAVPFPEGWHRSDALAPFRREIEAFVTEKFSGRELWAWKDPRTTVLFDLWRDVVAGLGMELACLFTVRNPLDVARSLSKRDGISTDKGFGIWFNYNITALRAVRGLTCVFLSYDRFLAGWEAELRRCADGLGIGWPADDSELKKRMAEFISPDLRHSSSTIERLKEAGAPCQVVELYGMLKGLFDGSAPGSGFDPEVDRLYGEFSSYASFFRHDMERICGLENALKEREARILSIEARIEQMERRLEEKERQLQEIMNSASWKVTAPLRSALGLFKR